MTQTHPIFFVTPPGLEHLVAAEATDTGFSNPKTLRGGVEVQGTIRDLWRASLEMRGPARLLLRLGEFRTMHIAQLHKRSKKIDWGQFVRPDRPVWVEASCHKSKIYHNKAAAQRVAKAISETIGCEINDTATLRVKVRIEDDLCTISLDTTGDPLHLRGHKGGMGKAPLRENLAALCLRACNYDGGVVVDPMCGSGTFITEAADLALGLQPGRSRQFAFMEMVGFDANVFADMRRTDIPPAADQSCIGFGSDRDQGAIKMAQDNAQLAGVDGSCQFTHKSLLELTPPPNTKPGLVLTNPPYGARIGNRKQLFGLYGALGQVMTERFQGWRFGMITSDPGLAKATGLAFSDISAPFSNGGLKICLYQSKL